MPIIRLPDGSERAFDQPVSVYQVAAALGPGLAKAALAGRANGKLVDLSHRLDTDADLVIITDRDPDGLEIIRHSTAHLLAMAAKQLFPDAQVTIGPTVENGFYYDFAFDRAFTPEDLERIEARMEELAQADYPVSRDVWPRDQAVAFFKGLGEDYKAEIIGDLPATEVISVYRQGDFTDLCRGPHVPSTGRLKAFKLMKVAGAYWRGDSRNAMLQRIYGTAWLDKKDLKAYLHQLEEAEKRDHRRLGKKLNLFHFGDEAPGMVFWHEKGYVLYRQVEGYMRDKLAQYGYQEVMTPQVLDRSLWERSGHWEKFSDGMFTTRLDERDYAIKPMNCPGHIQIFNQGLKSHHDLPLRIAEFGTVHRNEPSGTLHGLMRARRFVQDDAHLFCTEEQIESEVGTLIDLTFEVYRDFGFSDIHLAFSTRPAKRVGEDALWDQAEAALETCLRNKGLTYRVQPGEGAFYGPKIEFTLKDSIGRSWQCGTIQLDFSMPGRLGAHYIAEDNSKKVPVMIHRAILGSLERFIGILIEHYAGALPLWLAPVHAVLLNITDRQIEYVIRVQKQLLAQGLRVETDLRNEKIGFKIRAHTLDRVPYLLVAGDREVEQGTLAVRTCGGQDLGNLTPDALVERLDGAIRARVLA